MYVLIPFLDPTSYKAHAYKMAASGHFGFSQKVVFQLLGSIAHAPYGPGTQNKLYKVH